jgi:hypothetical protein
MTGYCRLSTAPTSASPFPAIIGQDHDHPELADLSQLDYLALKPRMAPVWPLALTRFVSLADLGPG